MVEQRGNQRRVIQDGIEVVVAIHEGTLNVYITIGTEADISYKHVCEEFSFKFVPKQKSKHLEEPIQLVKKGLKYIKGANAPNVKTRFATQEYKAEISISPKLFIPNEMWQEFDKQQQLLKNLKGKKKKRMKEAILAGNVVLGARRHTLKKRSRPTPYTNTNIARPYSGGRCTPK